MIEKAIDIIQKFESELLEKCEAETMLAELIGKKIENDELSTYWKAMSLKQ